MIYSDKATRIVAAAEESLRELLSQAVAAQAYRDVAAIAVAAEAVANVIKALTGHSDLDSKPAIIDQAPSEAQHEDAIRLRALEPQSRRAARTKVILSAKRDAYPRFLRDGDNLVKIAWSKKKRKPYEHRAPQLIVQELLRAVREKKGEGKLFEAADVLPLTNSNGDEYPSYQPYLALTWLRQVGLIAKRGRSGYLLKTGVATPENVARLWTSLETAE